MEKEGIRELIVGGEKALGSCNLKEAEEFFCRAMDECASDKVRTWDSYFKAVRSLLRIYSETQESDKQKSLFKVIDRDLEELGSDDKYKNYSSLINYEKGLREYFTRNFKKSEKFFMRAFDEALASSDQDEARLYAIWGMLSVMYEQKRFAEAKEAVDHLLDLLEEHKDGSMHQLYAAVHILKPQILRRQKRFGLALDQYWNAHRVIRKQKNWYLHYYVMLGIGNTYKDMGDKVRATVYYEFILRSIETFRLNQLRSIVQSEMSSLMGDMGSITPRKPGTDNDRKFVQFELLYLLSKEPGRRYERKDLVEKIWNEEYVPEVHDEKLSLHIGKLRKMIEPDARNPHYVLNEDEGFMFNPFLET